jgi:protein-S-isoprenylcysteine O-methyltransferase Ste14
METQTSAHQLRWRAAKGLSGFLAVLWGLIFAAAGTVDYWQGWIYWSLFASTTALITRYLVQVDPKLVERRLHSGASAETESPQKAIQGIASVFSLSTIVVPPLDHRFGRSDVPRTYSLVAATIFLIGFFIILLVFRENTYAASVIQVEVGQKVIATGPYRLVRHPMYAAALLSFLATPIALGSWWGLIPAVGLVMAMVARLRYEERFLVEHLAGYEAYRAQTRARLIPGVW